jgi:hypothetical protein
LPCPYVPRHQAQSILKTQVFKKPCKRYFAKKNLKHRFEIKKAKVFKKSAKDFCKKERSAKTSQQ